MKTHVLRELAEYAKDFEHKEFLMNITDTTEEAKVGLTDRLLFIAGQKKNLKCSFPVSQYI